MTLVVPDVTTIPENISGAASGVYNTTRQFGAALGLSGISAIAEEVSGVKAKANPAPNVNVNGKMYQ